MGLFSRKKKKEPPIEPQVPAAPPECKHKWKDFDWYVEWKYIPCMTDNGMIITKRENYGELDIKVKEPYVCIWCKKREDKILRSIHFDEIGEKEAKERFDEIRKNPHVRPREEIEDEIADMEHSIDREYLSIVETMYPKHLGSVTTR